MKKNKQTSIQCESNWSVLMNDITLMLNSMSSLDVRFLLVLNSFRMRLRKYVWSVSFSSFPYFSNFRYNCKTSRDVAALMVNNVPDSLKSHSITLTVQDEGQLLHRANSVNLCTRWRNEYGALLKQIHWNIGNAVCICWIIRFVQLLSWKFKTFELVALWEELHFSMQMVSKRDLK